MAEFSLRIKSEIKISGKIFQYPDESMKKNLPVKNTIVLIHAFPFSSDMYEPNFLDSLMIEKLNLYAKNIGSIQVILPDLPGFGQSESFIDQPKNLTPYADIIDEVITHFGVNKAMLGGCSMGGYISLEYYRKHQRKVEGLILIDTKALADTMEAKQNRYKTMEMIRTSLVHWAESSGSDGDDSNVHQSLHQYRQFLNDLHLRIISEHTKNNLPDISSLIYKTMHKQNPLAVIHALGAMASRKDTSHILKRAKIPILILVGENDRLTPVSVAEDIASIIKNGTLKIIPNAGHLSNLENLQAFNTELLKWYEQNSK